MKHIAITGASGFVGSSLAASLLQAGEHVVSLVRDPASPGARAYEFGMDETTLRSQLAGCSHVIHLAAKVHVMRGAETVDARREFELANVEATQRLARAAAQTGASHLVFLSTAKVYGEQSPDRQPFREQDRARPQGAYAISKLAAERLLAEISQTTGLNISIIRPPLIYGYGVKANFAALSRMAGTPIALPFGGLHNARSLVCLQNLNSLINRCLERDLKGLSIFNVSDGEDVSTAGLLKLLASAKHRSPWLLPIPTPAVAMALRIIGKASIAERMCGNFQVSIEKARVELGWKPPLNLADAIAMMFSPSPDNDGSIS